MINIDYIRRCYFSYILWDIVYSIDVNEERIFSLTGQFFANLQQIPIDAIYLKCCCWVLISVLAAC